MARTTADEVREILTTDWTDPQVEVYIEVANKIVTAGVTCGLSAETLEEIERQLTAHLITVQDDPQNITEEKLGNSSIKYSNIWEDGLKATSYGQTALLLDTCGGLANLGKRGVSVTAITSFTGKTWT